MTSGVDLDGEVRRVDPDRWLSSRFIADPTRRADVVALYAFDHELARAASATSNPLAAEIRLAWWAEAVAEIYTGRPPRRHPTTEAVARVIHACDLPSEVFDVIIQARIGILGRQSLTQAEVADWARGAQGGLARLVALVLGAGKASTQAEAAGTVWGMVMLRRSGRSPKGPLTEALAVARRDARALSTGAFPAALPASLARAEGGSRSLSELEKRLRLTWAVMTGRL